MSGPREPHRKMAADGARAKNAYAHGVRFRLEAWRPGQPSFHKLVPQRNRLCDLPITLPLTRWLKFFSQDMIRLRHLEPQLAP
jgi:hypothetical protein